jgi:hypothetical protein
MQVPGLNSLKDNVIGYSIRKLLQVRFIVIIPRTARSTGGTTDPHKLQSAAGKPAPFFEVFEVIREVHN